MERLTGFMDVPGRDWALETKEAVILRDALPPDIWDKLRKCFLDGDIVSAQTKEVLSYLKDNSIITQMVQADPTSSLTFEYLYLKKPITNNIDKYFPAGKAATAIYERLNTLKEYLPEVIRKEIGRKESSKDKYTILNIGSGPGHDTIEILNENRDLAEKVHVICLDPDGEALKIGMERVKEYGLLNSFSFVEKKLHDFSGDKFDMLLLIGIFCTRQSDISKKVIGNLTVYARWDGIIVFSMVKNKMVLGDPLTDFIMRLGGWHMKYKYEGEPAEIAMAAGWKPIDRFYDNLDYNCMTIARLQWNPSVCMKKTIYPVYKFFKSKKS
jgi:hypothetical protein